MRRESKEHNEKATEEAENGLHLTWDISMSKIYFVLWQTLYGSQNIRLGQHSSLVSLPLAPPRGCRAIPYFPLCLSTQMNATVGVFFQLKTQYLLFQGHILSRRVEVLS